MLKTFDVISGQIRVSDPCYKVREIRPADSKISILALKAKKGRWVVEVEKDEKVYEDVVSKVVAYYDDQQSSIAGFDSGESDFNKVLAMMMAKNTESIEEEKTFASVESGQIGIFDNKSYRDNNIVANESRMSDKVVCEDDPWYSLCCDRSLSKDRWGTVPNGCVSSCSKEGNVEVVTHTNSYKEVVKIEINFENNVEIKEEEE